ncbi:MAG: hypothetical protein EPO26_03385 [Chloroflexota bacterium]|nr:MAG: hypothetical protein EPO26_03385 [Chloroflexota bacterium]
MTPIRVCLELGRRRVFASALDWPGWCRSGRDEERALAALSESAARYAPIATAAREPLPDATTIEFSIAERLPGTITTDFGAPGEIASTEADSLGAEENGRIRGLVNACWAYLDRVVDSAPAVLRKGPRGGGRDRDAVFEHVLAADVAYARKLGLRVSQPAIGDRGGIVALRAAILGAIEADAPPTEDRWPGRYAARRIAWHVLDHAWEIEDRATALT